MKVAITGGPKTGKTTLSAEYEHVRHTDDLIHLGWSEASTAISLWFDDHEVQTIEGVAVPRALRKWLRANPSGKPCDRVIYMRRALVRQCIRQAAMS